MDYEAKARAISDKFLCPTPKTLRDAIATALREAVEAAVVEEREACAKIIDGFDEGASGMWCEDSADVASRTRSEMAVEAAAKIRARGATP